MRTLTVLAMTLLGASASFGAEVYPAKAVRVIVPFAPGGTTDLTARVTSQQLSAQLGKAFVVDNRTGAGGTIGYGVAARAAPDGYTLLLADPSFSIVPSLFKSLPFDVVADFAPITQIMSVPMVLVVHPSLNTGSLKEFIALAQRSPGKINYGSGGAGSSTHLPAELFNKIAGVSITHVPYKGAGEAMAAVVGGQVQVLLTSMPTALAHVNGGRVRALAVTTDAKRSPALPGVPSMSEAGLAGMAVQQWFGFVGPAGLPPAVVDKLHAEVLRAISVPEVKDRFVQLGAEPVGSSPDEFGRLIRNERQRWAEIVKVAGVTQE